MRSPEHKQFQEEIVLSRGDEMSRPKSARLEDIEGLQAKKAETLEGFIEKFPALSKQIAGNLEEIREGYCGVPSHG